MKSRSLTGSNLIFAVIFFAISEDGKLIVISVFSYIIEFLTALIYFNDISNPKIKRKYAVLIGAGLYFAGYIIFNTVGRPILNAFIFILINFLFSLLCYETGIKASILSSLFLTAMMSGTEFLTMNILSFAHDGDINAYKSNIATLTVMLLFSKTMYFSVSKLSTTLGFYLGAVKKSRVPAFLFLFPLCSLVVLETFWIILSNNEVSKTVEFVVYSSSIAMVLSVILTFVFYGRTTKQLAEFYKAQNENQRIATDAAYYAILDKQNEELKTVLHDEKNHLSVIKSLANQPEVSEYIDQIYGQIAENSLFGNTGNKILDLIINKYQYISKNAGIDFYVSIKTANLSYIESSDLTTLLGNILDNAVEAAKNSEHRKIDLSLNKMNGFDILTCINSSSNKPRVVGNNLKTTKKEANLHGLGIKSIKRIVKKYHGSFEWSYDDDQEEFTVYVAFN